MRTGFRALRTKPYLTGFLTGIVLGLVSIGCATRAPYVERVSLTEEQIEKNMASFELTWEIIRDRNWDATLGGLDWDAVRDELLPKAQEARNMAAFRSVIHEMGERLNQSHFGVIPEEVYREMTRGSEDSEDEEDTEASSSHSEDGEAGLVIGLDGDTPIVVQVVPTYPAANAGVQPGWTVISIDGDQVPVRRMRETFSDSTTSYLMISEAFNNRFEGKVGDIRDVVFQDGNGQRYRVALQLAPARGEKVVFGNLPIGHVWYATGVVDDTIRYFTFNYFMDPVRLMPALQQAVESAMEMEGLIIDLRGNKGGIGGMTMGMTGWFVDKPNQYLGTMVTRQGEIRFVVNPRSPHFSKPLAVLVDGVSASSAEIFAGGLRDVAGARIFGMPTAGAALPATIEPLPNGDYLMYPIADYITANGERFEGQGIQPDELVLYNRAHLLAGADPILDAAVHWIRGSK